MKKVYFLLLIIMVFGCSKDDSISPHEQLEIDKSIINEYLEENGIDADEHSSGIRFTHNEIGAGLAPLINSTVYITIRSRFLDGSIFYENLDGETAVLTNVIDALKFMIPEMNEGSNMTIYAPSAYCFGTQSSESLPANSILIFDIELISIVDNAEEQFTIDTTQIDNYLENSEITTLVHESGIRYNIETEGVGFSPTLGNRVNVSYRGFFLNGVVFDQNVDGATFPLKDLIEAWKIMIPTMKPGGKITIYAPSGLCYGPKGAGSIPPNANLIFEIELISIQ